MNRNAQRILVRNWQHLARSNYKQASDYKEAGDMVAADAYYSICLGYTDAARILGTHLRQREEGYARGETDEGIGP